MSTVKLFAPKADPTPEEIRERCAEIHAQRLAKWEAENPPLSEEEHREAERIRVRQYKKRKAVEQANTELQEQETEEETRDPRQVEQWIPVPSVDDDRREPSAVRHRREFYTRFFPQWSQLSALDETLARDQSSEWREEKLRHGLSGSPAVPTWTIEASFGDRTARERIDDEIRALSIFRVDPDFDPLHPAFVALQRRVLARYLWGIRREGRRVPKTPNWGYKLANQLILERDETEPLDLFDVDPETVARVTNGVKLPAKPKRERKRVKRDIIPFKTALARKMFRSSK